MEMSKELMDMLAGYVTGEIGGKALNGVTYAFEIKRTDKKDLAVSKVNQKYEKYSLVLEELRKCGFGEGEIFRIIEVANGYIFDIDIDMLGQIVEQIYKGLDKVNGDEKEYDKAFYMRMRKIHLARLAKYCKMVYDKESVEGAPVTVEIALYNRNSVPQVVLCGKLDKKEYAKIAYEAFMLSHDDIECANREALIDVGLRVTDVRIYEILPNEMGVRASITVGSTEDIA